MDGHPGGLSMYPRHLRVEDSPFSAAPNPRYLYMSDKHREALAHLLYGVSAAGGGFVLLTGEVGTGKTTLCRCLVDQLPENVDLALCFNPRLSETELLEHICDEFGVGYPSNASLRCLVSCLNRHLLEAHARGRTTVLLIDEAQNLSRSVLEQVRLLTNLETERAKLLQIILVGQPELDQLLTSSELRQLAQRITARYHLTALNAKETRNLIRHRLLVGGLPRTLFTSPALREVYRRSQGIPRLINSICDRALLAAYARDVARVNRWLVRAAAAEVRTSPAQRRTSVAWVSAPIGAVAGFAVAAILLSGPAMVGWPSTSFADLLSLTRRAARTLAANDVASPGVTLTGNQGLRPATGDAMTSPPAGEPSVDGGVPPPSAVARTDRRLPDAKPVLPHDALQQLILEGRDALLDAQLTAVCTETAIPGSRTCELSGKADSEQLGPLTGNQPRRAPAYDPALGVVDRKQGIALTEDVLSDDAELDGGSPGILGVWRVGPGGATALLPSGRSGAGSTDHVVNP